MAPLTGRELLALVKENPEITNRSELARMAGYERETRKGDTVADLSRFVDALLEAKGVKLEAEPRGRAAANETTVHANGSVLIGSIYSKSAGVGPGDVLGITVDPSTGQIVLDVLSRVEGSPLPFKTYDSQKRKKKGASEDASESGTAVAAGTAESTETL